MEIILKKKAQKYLDSVDSNTRKKLGRALNKLSRLEGDIAPMAGRKNLYRYKIEHYRILFEREKGALIITVIEIGTRGNVY